MRISIVAAMAKNGVIGKGSTLPWHLPADLKRFKTLTFGKPIVMGRKTLESIGKPLPGRLNIILTRNKAYVAQDCVVVGSVADVFAAAGAVDETMIIGGAEIIALFLPIAERMYLTVIHDDIVGDTYFPVWDETAWREIFREDHVPDAKNPHHYSFITLQRA